MRQVYQHRVLAAEFLDHLIEGPFQLAHFQRVQLVRHVDLRRQVTARDALGSIGQRLHRLRQNA